MATEQSSSAKSFRLIDFHVHLRKPQPHSYPQAYGLSLEQLINRMDREGIDKTVLQPLESPEAKEYFLTEEAVAARDLYPERLIAFVSVDPRRPHAVEHIVAWLEKRDCRGFGEFKNELDFDDPRSEAIYEVCNEYALPLVFHIDPTLCRDEIGLPRVAAMAEKYPAVRFVGHGPGFWTAISGDDDRKGGYPTGPVTAGGAVDRLLGEHDNMYAELSGHSGYNAMTRDTGFTEGFLERNHHKLIFGTDYIQAGQKLPQIEWLASIDLPIEWRQEIAFDNALRILGMAGE